VQRTIVMSLAVVFGLCGTAMAKPDWDRIERTLPIRSEYRMRMDVDGRGNFHERSARPSAERPAMDKDKPAPLREGPTMASIPMKTQIMLKMQNGGEGRATDDSKKSNGNQPGSSVAAQKDGVRHAAVTVNGEKRPLSKAEKDLLCKQAGVCLSDLASSDDPGDKAY
jgi:hypothetical protein